MKTVEAWPQSLPGLSERFLTESRSDGRNGSRSRFLSRSGASDQNRYFGHARAAEGTAIQSARLVPGSMLIFQKHYGEPLALEANGHQIALGETVKVGDKFGIRILSLGKTSPS